MLQFPINTKILVQKANKALGITSRSIRVDDRHPRVVGDYNFVKPKRDNADQFKRNRHSQLLKTDLTYKLAWLTYLDALRDNDDEAKDIRPDCMTWNNVIVTAKRVDKLPKGVIPAFNPEAGMCLDYVRGAR